MEDFYDIEAIFDFGEELNLPVSEPIDVPCSDTYYERSHAYWMQIPMPSDAVPTGDAPLAGLDDETLLHMSPALIVHAQRTAACGGLQVVSPRVVALASSAARTTHPKRTSDMFIVGSVASRNLDWPVLSEPVSSSLFPDEPIDSSPYSGAIREVSVTRGLLAAGTEVGDPVARAFMVGRALVDLQRRPDVGGSGDALAAHLASCWGVDVEWYEALAEASLAPVGPLLRYAIRADDAYPMLNAPVQARKCISVGANTAGRILYGEHAAVDWRRLRVLAEAVFYMSSRTEGHSLVEMSLMQPPGDPKASPIRPGVIQMRPLPGSVWTHDPSTFRLDIADTTPLVPAVNMPLRVSQAAAAFYDTARPIAVSAWHEAQASLVPSISMQPQSRTGDALVQGFVRTLALASTHGTRGRTASAAVRDHVYAALSSSVTLSGIRTLWIVRYLRETADACGVGAQLDGVATRQVASRLSDMASDLRIKLAVESNRRGATLDEWWEDVRALLPREHRSLREGAASWAVLTAHFLLHPYSHKWSNLAKALGYSSHLALARRASRDIRLPAVLGSRERVYEAACATIGSLAGSYGAYYGAMHEVAGIVSAQLKRMGNPTGAYKVKCAGMMWDIRAKCASTCRFRLEDGTADRAGVIAGSTGRYHLVTAPYPAYQRWHAMLSSGRAVSLNTRASFPHHVTGAVSDAFKGRTTPLFPLGAQSRARVFRYAMHPHTLSVEMERTLAEMRADVAVVVAEYEAERPMTDIRFGSPVEVRTSTFDASAFKPRTGTFWDWLPRVDPSDALMLEETVSQLDPAHQEEVFSRMYDTLDELWAAIDEVAAIGEASRVVVRDSVV